MTVVTHAQQQHIGRRQTGQTSLGQVGGLRMAGRRLVQTLTKQASAAGPCSR